jgi:hypothetical protein
VSMHERTGKRDLTYSAWHRPDRIRAYLGPRRAAQLTVIDIDWCEYCAVCREPVALIETARDDRGNRTVKPATVTFKLAKKAAVPAYVVLYSAAGEGVDASLKDFRVQQAGQTGWVAMSPSQYAEFLWSLHESHRCA